MPAFSTEVIEIVDETHDVKTFKLTKPEGYAFIPGQFTMVSFDMPGYPEKRKPFTFSNSPSDDHLEMTIKQVGEFTKAFFTLKPGDTLKIEEPRGKSLNFDENDLRTIVFLAGGSGITPFMSILRHAIKNDLPHRFILLFGNRDEKDIIYEKELIEMAKDDRIEVYLFIANQDPGWDGEVGFIDKEKIIKHVDKPDEKLFYICGPPIMNHVMTDTLHEMGIADDNIRIDKWEIPGKHDGKTDD